MTSLTRLKMGAYNILKSSIDKKQTKKASEKKKIKKKQISEEGKTSDEPAKKWVVFDDAVSEDITSKLKDEAIDMFLNQQEGHAAPEPNSSKRVDFVDEDGDICSLRLRKGVIRVFVNDEINGTYPEVSINGLGCTS